MRKLLTAFLALVMVLSMTVPAFAKAYSHDYERQDGEEFERTILFMDEDDLDSDGVDVPVYFDVTVTPDPSLQDDIDEDGTIGDSGKNKLDNANPVYSVEVHWLEMKGLAQMYSTYSWDAEQLKYVPSTTQAGNSEEAVVSLIVVNKSNQRVNCVVDYTSEKQGGNDISYVPNNEMGIDLNKGGSKTYELGGVEVLQKATKTITNVNNGVDMGDIDKLNFMGTVELQDDVMLNSGNDVEVGHFTVFIKTHNAM